MVDKTGKPVSQRQLRVGEMIRQSLGMIFARNEAQNDVVIETQGALLVALDTELTVSLIQEGHAREAIRYIQQFRKDSGLEISDRINLQITTESKALLSALEINQDKISGEVLAASLNMILAEPSGEVVDINEIKLGLLLG